MRNGLKKALRIGLSRTGIGLLQTGGWLRRRTDLLADITLSEEEFASPDRLSARLGSLITEYKCSKLPVTIVLADDLARLFMVTPPHNTTRLQDCQIAAQMRFQSLYGAPASDWQLQADWDVVQPFLVCALPDMLLKVLRQVASEHRLILVEIVPQFIASWNRWCDALNGSAWFGVAHENQLTLGAVNEKRLSMVRTTSIPADAWQNQQWLSEHLHREALRLNLPAPQQLQVCGHVPGHWAAQTMGSVNCLRVDAAQQALSGMPASGSVVLAQSGVRR